MNKIFFLLLAAIFASCTQSNSTVIVNEKSNSILFNEVSDTNWTNKVIKTEAEWKNLLTIEQYNIAREKGTERPFTSKHYENHDKGVFVCVACDNPLFNSETKFDSGTGWPSFFAPYSSKSLGTTTDNSHGMVRDEIHCLRCDAHLGHVFNDGPKPSGLRYCINGIGLNFIPKTSKKAIATFAGGCFWCEEAIFESIKGVSEVISGYSGGDEKNTNYKTVGSGKTSHAEAFEVYYDPSQISFKDLMRVYLASIDPTQVNGQGPDQGTQYRSIAFYRDENEKKIINEAILTLSDSGTYKEKIAVEIKPYTFFIKAEEYHQNYVKLHPENPYVQQESLPRKKRTLAQVKDLIK